MKASNHQGGPKFQDTLFRGELTGTIPTSVSPPFLAKPRRKEIIERADQLRLYVMAAKLVLDGGSQM